MQPRNLHIELSPKSWKGREIEVCSTLSDPLLQGPYMFSIVCPMHCFRCWHWCWLFSPSLSVIVVCLISSVGRQHWEWSGILQQLTMVTVSASLTLRFFWMTLFILMLESSHVHHPTRCIWCRIPSSLDQDHIAQNSESSSIFVGEREVMEAPTAHIATIPPLHKSISMLTTNHLPWIHCCAQWQYREKYTNIMN